MIEIVLMYHLDMISFFLQGPRGATISKLSTFQIFPNFGGGGVGVIENHFFPKFKIVQIIQTYLAKLFEAAILL